VELDVFSKYRSQHLEDPVESNQQHIETTYSWQSGMPDAKITD
jgi:hypothetical protein